MLDAGARERALRNIKSAAWARDLVQAARQTADYLVAQPLTYAASMISELTPWYEYGMTCPNCVGVKSQEGVGHGLLHWDFRDPDKLTCTFCGHVYPSAQYPETQNLVCPRTGQTFTFYLNPKEQADPENRTGELAYHWVGHPMHMSFSGTIRWYKASFMIKGVSDLALTGFLTGDTATPAAPRRSCSGWPSATGTGSTTTTGTRSPMPSPSTPRPTTTRSSSSGSATSRPRCSRTTGWTRHRWNRLSGAAAGYHPSTDSMGHALRRVAGL